MGFTLVNELPTPAEILEQFPLADHLAALKKERDEEIKKVITGQSNKFLEKPVGKSEFEMGNDN